MLNGGASFAGTRVRLPNCETATGLVTAMIHALRRLHTLTIDLIIRRFPLAVDQASDKPGSETVVDVHNCHV